jgi:hypothetical protein
MVTIMTEETLQKLQAIAACRDCSLEEALNIAIEHTLKAQNKDKDFRGVTRASVEIPKDMRRFLDESA